MLFCAGFCAGCPGIYCHYKGSGQTHHPSAKKEIPDASVDEPYAQHGRSDEHHHARTFLASCLLAFGDRLRTKTDDIVMSRTAALKSAELSVAGAAAYTTRDMPACTEGRHYRSGSHGSSSTSAQGMQKVLFGLGAACPVQSN